MDDPARPTAAGERIETIDILRGFALLGILIVNILAFSGYQVLRDHWTGPADRATAWIVRLFAQGKFLTLFAFLFGLGFTLQLRRAETRGGAFLPIYLRRLSILLAIGLLHVVLSPTEVLHTYAIAGLFLLLFRSCSPRALLLWALLLMPLPYLQVTVDWAMTERQAQEENGVSDDAESDSADSWNPYASAEAARVYSQGSLREVAAYNVRNFARWRNSWTDYLWMLLVPLPVSLLGMYAGRRRVLEQVAAHLPSIRNVLWSSLGIAIAGTLAAEALFQWTAPAGWGPWIWFIGSVIWILAVWGLSLGYASGITMLVERDGWKKRLAPLQSVGRLALTHYLLQTLLCVSLFYGFGLGLHGKIGSAGAVAIGVVIFMLQIGLSVWWLRRFRFGPVEWLWRSLTYWSLQPMRLRERRIRPGRA